MNDQEPVYARLTASGDRVICSRCVRGEFGRVFETPLPGAELLRRFQMGPQWKRLKDRGLWVIPARAARRARGGIYSRPSTARPVSQKDLGSEPALPAEAICPTCGTKNLLDAGKLRLRDFFDG